MLIPDISLMIISTMMCRNQLRAHLNQLPVAKNKVEVVIPEEMQVDEVNEEGIDEDAADTELRRQEAARKAEEIEFKKRSQVGCIDS